jgi:hypothetical protein
LLALALAAAAVIWRMGTDHPEAMLWVALLAAQAIPYIAALACGWISQRSFAQTAHVSIELDPVDNSGMRRAQMRMPALASDSGQAGQRTG